MRTGWLTAVGLGLLAGGCTTPPEPPAAPPPAPATRALVAWAGTACAQAAQFDELRAQFDRLPKPGSPTGPGPDTAAFPLVGAVTGAASKVEGIVKALTKLEPSKIAAADQHLAALTKTLRDLQPKLPSARDAALILRDPDEEKKAKAKQIGDHLTAIEPQLAKLTGLAERTPELLSSHNLAPHCAPGKNRDDRARTLLSWMNTMCETTRSLAAMRTDPLNDPTLTDPRFARVADITLDQYLRSARETPAQVVKQLKPLPPTGIKAADDHRANVLAAVEDALPKLPNYGYNRPPLNSAPLNELKEQATQVAHILTALKPQPPSLAELAAPTPELATAHGLAPNCEPPASPAALPAAANGTNLAACQSGKCQIQVTDTAELSLRDFKFKITVAPSGVTVTHDSGLLRLGADSEGSFGKPGTTIKLRLAGHRENTAVLDITAS